MKTKMRRLAIAFIACAWSAGVWADSIVLNFSGKDLRVIGEYINGVRVSEDQQEFAPLFQNGKTVIGSIAYDTNQPDVDPDPNTGTYKIGKLSVAIPALGISASRSSNSMQISAFNDTSNPDDQFFVYANGVDAFSSNVGLPDPVAFSIHLFGSTSMLADDRLPVRALDWRYGDVSFDFIASDGTKRQILMVYVPAVVQEPTPISSQPPTITSLNPVAGTAGETVTISGAGFDPIPANNTVFFGAVKAEVVSASPTSLTVAVPAGATFGPISVAVANLTAFSSQFFLSIFNNTVPGIGASSLATKVDFVTGSEPSHVAIGDLDGDGKPDLAVANYSSNTLSVFHNTSATGAIDHSSFAPKVDFATGGEPWQVAVGDVDGDGKLDVIVTHRMEGRVSVFHNASAPGVIDASSFAPKVDFTAGGGPVGVSISDVDGDGKPEIITANQFSHSVSVFRNTSTAGRIDASSFAAKVDFTAGTEPVSVAAGDVDGDGKPDLIVANEASKTVSVFRNTSTPGTIDAFSFAVKVDFSTQIENFGSASSVAIGDLDGDNKLDIAVALSTANSVSVFRNTSTSGRIDASSFAAKVDFAPLFDPRSVAIGDVDGDGKPDLVAAEFSGNRVSVFRNASVQGRIDDGSFASVVQFTTGEQPHSVAIGDMDGDGKPDLVVANFNSGSVSVFHNQTDTESPGSVKEINLSVSDATAEPGATGVEVHISVDDATGIAGGDLTLTYNADVLTATQVRGMPLLISSGITVVSNPATPGQVKISFAGATGISSGSGALIEVVFDVNPNTAPGAYELSLTSVVFRNERATPVTVGGIENGVFTVQGASLPPSPPPGPETKIKVSVSGARGEPGATNVEVSIGVDDATGIAGGDLTLIYNADALTATQVRGTPLLISSGITLVSNLATPGQVKISSAGTTGIPSGSGALVKVVFDVKSEAAPGTYALSLTSVIFRNERAVPLTVESTANGTFTVQAPSPPPPEPGINVSVSNAQGETGATGVEVSIEVDDAAGIAGGDLTLTYNADALTAAQVQAMSLLTSSGITLVSNLATPGQVKISFAGTTGIPSGSGVLVKVVFDVKSEAAPGTYALSLTRVVFRNERAGPLTVESTVNGTFTMQAASPPPPPPPSEPGNSTPDVSDTQKAASADFNGNKTVDFSDFLEFASAYGSSQSKYDLNANGTVDFPDFLSFAGFYGQEIVGEPTSQAQLTMRVGAEGGVIEGSLGTEFEGFRLVIAPGTFERGENITVQVKPTDEFQSGLSSTLFSGIVVGPVFDINVSGILRQPAELTLPYDPALVPTGDILDDLLIITRRSGPSYEIETGGSEEESAQVEIDKVSNTLTVQVDGFSERAVVSVAEIRRIANHAPSIAMGCEGSGMSFKALDLQDRANLTRTRSEDSITGIVVHSTFSTNPNATVFNSLTSGITGFQAHYYIERNGDTYRLVDDLYIANHVKGGNYNYTTIGIELVQHVDRNTRLVTDSEPITSNQYESLKALIAGLNSKYGRDLEIFYHSDIDTRGIKKDPAGFDRSQLTGLIPCNPDTVTEAGYIILEPDIWSAAYAINNNGDVIGWIWSRTVPWRAVLWRREGGRRDISIDGRCRAFDVNDFGFFTGWCKAESVVGFGTPGTPYAAIWNEAGNVEIFYYNGVQTVPSGQAINSLGHIAAGGNPYGPNYFWSPTDTVRFRIDYNMYVFGINDQDHIVGATSKALEIHHPQPYVWTKSTGAVLLPLLPGDTEGAAYAINNDGDIVGYSGRPKRAVLWRGGVVIPLGGLPGGSANSVAYAINTKGEVVGWATGQSISSRQRGFLWTVEMGMTQLPVPSAGVSSESEPPFDYTATDISDNGDVVGYLGNLRAVDLIPDPKASYAYAYHAVLWPSERRP